MNGLLLPWKDSIPVIGKEWHQRRHPVHETGLSREEISTGMHIKLSNWMLISSSGIFVAMRVWAKIRSKGWRNLAVDDLFLVISWVRAKQHDQLSRTNRDV